MSHSSLQITQHSRTAIQYTVTNKPFPRSPLLKTLLLIEHTLRLVLSLWSLIVLFLIAQQQWSPGSTSNKTTIYQSSNGSLTIPVSSSHPFTHPVTSSTASSITSTLLSIISHPVTSGLDPIYPLLCLGFCYMLTLANYTTIESLLVLHTLGLQTRRVTTGFPLFVWLVRVLGGSDGLEGVLASRVTRFWPTSLVQDVLVHEAFVGWEVRYFLGIVVKGEDRVVVVFERCLPRLDVVERVWRGCRKGLWMDGGSRRGENKV